MSSKEMYYLDNGKKSDFELHGSILGDDRAYVVDWQETHVKELMDMGVEKNIAEELYGVVLG